MWSEIRSSKRYLHSHVHWSLITIAKAWKKPMCPSMDECKRKCIYIYTHNRILFTHKKGNRMICDNMSESWGHYAKGNKSDRKTNTICSHCIWYLKKIKLTERDSKLIVSRGKVCIKVAQASSYKMIKF